MEFINMRELKTETKKIRESLKKERDLVVTLNGKPVAVLTGVNGQTLEGTLRAIKMERGKWAIEQIQRDSVRRGINKMSMKEINAEIKKARKEMKS